MDALARAPKPLAQMLDRTGCLQSSARQAEDVLQEEQAPELTAG